MALTDEQVAQYHKDGYLVLGAAEHGIVEPEELRSWTDEIFTWPDGSHKWLLYHETNTQGERQLMRTERFAEYHQGYGQLLFGKKLRSMLEQLSGDDMSLFKDKINYKLPSANGFKPHIDAPAYTHISQTDFLTANIAIDEATLANGCLEVVPYSHTSPVDLARGGLIADSWVLQNQWVPVPLKPGDMVLFGSALAHRSKGNDTRESRRSLYATYNRSKVVQAGERSLRERYYADRLENFPPEGERVPGKDYSSGAERYAYHYFGKD